MLNILFGILTLIFGCKPSSSSFPPSTTCDTCAQAGKVTQLQVNLSATHQTIHSFGASDAWSTKFVGNWADLAKKNQIADYLFSMDVDSSGNPKGIGLSLWRFNIGAGSYEQGDSSGIADDYRREECFQNPDGTYSWNKEQGNQWFLNAAKQRGVKYLLGFACSPPVYMTINGKAYGTGTAQFNLAPSNFKSYADFLVAVCAHFQGTGTPLDYISPVNEPQWNWGASNNQEGTAASNTDIADLVRILGPDLQAGGVNTHVVPGEAGQITFLNTATTDNRGDQINQWFNPSDSNYIGGIPNVDNTISYHSYFTTCPDNTLVQDRQAVATAAANIGGQANTRGAAGTGGGLNLWMTEFGVLSSICGTLNGYPRNTNIDYGLYVAGVIHNDLAVAGASSWQWWLGVNPYNYSDGLVYINAPNGAMDPEQSKTDGLVSDSKQLWCLGNFSRFVRPGMVRVDAVLGNNTDPVSAAGSIMVSAYTDPVAGTVVIVLVNTETTSSTISLSGLGGSATLTGSTLTAYVTSAGKNLQKTTMAAANIQLEPRSVTTLMANYH
ncbi:MAG TPA: glycoside hydrolase [Puia sp.]|nr:glycoside hydrolase [Puia sp.]